ncbi:protein toll-like [Mercenaria mercenaria]|uniref:protein toll-like n=1 Tax=Mercenaria mercenaria TaxID=6596 RepID=UPI00234E40B9|nr:protein toll-like [Mercenaria mercenaria]
MDTMRQIILICGVFCSYTSVLAIKPCAFRSVLGRENSLNGSNYTLNGNLIFLLVGNQNNCSIDLDFIDEQTHGHTLKEVNKRNSGKTEKFKEYTYNFLCDNNMAVHFVRNNMSVVGKLKISVALVFWMCDVYLNELSLFLKDGIIRSISQRNNFLLHARSQKIGCPFAKYMQIIAANIECDDVTWTHFFWELCNEIFENVNTLQLRACKTNHFRLKSKLLVKKFPKLQSLQLVNIDLATQMRFPWTQSHIDAADQDIVKFESSENGTNITVTAAGRTIWIRKSKMDISNMLHLNGNIAEIVINNADIEQNESQMFKYVTGLHRVDLSSNNLTEINELLFKNQTEIQSIHLKENKLTSLPSHVFKDQHKLLFLDLSNNILSSIDSNLLRNQRYLQELHLEINRLQFLPKDFLKEQIHSLKYLYLHSNPLMTIPVMPFYGTKLDIFDIHNSNVTGESFVELLNTLRFSDFLIARVEWKESDPSYKVGKHPLRQTVLDLSYCKIKNVPLDLGAQNMTALNVVQLFSSFHIKTDGNPLTCNCHLYPLELLLSKVNDTKMDWTCMYPQELQGRAIADITKHDLYCADSYTDCPELCSCYVRHDSSNLIVDCRNIKMPALPLKMPKYPLELWFKNASVLKLEPRDYLLNVSVLDLSENRLTYISPLAAAKLKNVATLKLESNYLTTLPVQIKYSMISRASLAGKALLCDCHTRWMAWLQGKQCPITDIKCTDNNKNVDKFINLPDSSFVCNEIIPPSIAEHVIFPSVVIGSILFVITVLSLTIYFQRFTVRVLLYMIFGVSVCDAFTDNPDDFKRDCVVIYDKNDRDFVENNIKIHLQESGYNVADMYTDPVIGFTLVDGIRKLIYRSRRVIFCMTKQSLHSELMITLWNIASERAMKNHIGSIILIVDKDFKANCTEENMKLFIKNGRYIRMDSKMLYKSIEYLMSSKKRMNQNQQEVNNTKENYLEINQIGEIHLCEHNPYAAAGDVQENLTEGTHDTYIVYPDVIDELHQLTRYEIIPFLRENKQNVCVLQDEFVFGDDIRLCIEPKLDEAKHVIFIISNETLEDDVSQFVLTTILTKAVVSSSNFLLLFTYGQTDVDKMPENLKKYVNSYITASVNDPKFKERMLEALMFEENGIDKEDTDSLLTENDIDDASWI